MTSSNANTALDVSCQEKAIDYYLNDILDEDAQEEIYDYFMEDAETDSIEAAHEEFEGDYSEEELKLMRIKFMSEVAN